MNLPLGLVQCLAELTGPILEVNFVGGGDISAARRLRSEQGTFFLKYHSGLEAPLLFASEAKGLNLLRDRSSIRIPQVLAQGSTPNIAYLLLEYVEPGWANNSFWETFGRTLAQLHRNTAPQFGLEFDNYIGSLPQSNDFLDDWAGFYQLRRLEPQTRLAREKGFLDAGDMKHLEQLYSRLPAILPPEAPALIHGDLWSGNYLVSSGQDPVLFDPSVSYSHREMDLAMSRLFGGFDWRFYRSYEEAYPLFPGLEDRVPIYQLYYLLVHVNLFGQGYVESVRNIICRF